MSITLTDEKQFGRYSMVLVNPTDRSWTRQRFVLWFGACGTTRLMVWANSLDDALDECVDWIADNAPGLLADEQVNEEYERAIAEGLSEGEAVERATLDTTCAGNAGHYIHAWEWDLVCTDPTRAEVLALLGR